MSRAPRPPILGAILAGGDAHTGTPDEGLQPFRGRPRVAGMVESLRSQVDDVLIVATRHRLQYGAFGKVMAGSSNARNGELANTATALEAAGERWALCVTVDCATPPVDLVARMLAPLSAQPATGCAVVHDGTRLRPLIALYRPGLAFAAVQALEDDLPLPEWQRQIGLLVVDFADASAAFTRFDAPEV